MAATETAVDVVNAVDKIFTLVSSNDVETMPELASALPPGVDSNAANRWDGWSDTPQSLTNTVVYTPNLPGFSDTKFHLGMRYNYGGRADGQPWTYIKDLQAFVIVDSTMFVHSLDIAVKFSSTGTPISSAKTVMLTGGFNVRFTHKLMGIEFSEFYITRAFGNGAADIRPM